jgi:hypothetical protein
VIEIGSRRRAQPAPPHVLADSLITPDSDPSRPWLDLLGDEQCPRVVEADPPRLVVWSSLWPKRPEALIRFDLEPERSGGTHLRWTLLVDTEPDASRLGHYRHRVNLLINGNLRLTYGQ